MSDYIQQNKNTISDYFENRIEIVSQVSPKNEYNENISSKELLGNKEYSIKKTTFKKVKYVQK